MQVLSRMGRETGKFLRVKQDVPSRCIPFGLLCESPVPGSICMAVGTDEEWSPGINRGLAGSVQLGVRGWGPCLGEKQVRDATRRAVAGQAADRGVEQARSDCAEDSRPSKCRDATARRQAVSQGMDKSAPDDQGQDGRKYQSLDHGGLRARELSEPILGTKLLEERFELPSEGAHLGDLLRIELVRDDVGQGQVELLGLLVKDCTEAHQGPVGASLAAIPRGDRTGPEPSYG